MTGVPAPTGAIGSAQIRNPAGLVERFILHCGLADAKDVDDIRSDAMFGIVKAVASWQDDGRYALTTWCWYYMRSLVNEGRRRRSRWRTGEVLVDDVTVVASQWRLHTIDPGFKQVEDRATLQRWADIAHLTDLQADLIAWMAVHGGSVSKGTERSPLHGHPSAYRNGLGRLRRAAVTGRPPIAGAPAPGFTVDDALRTVDG